MTLMRICLAFLTKHRHRRSKLTATLQMSHRAIEHVQLDDIETLRTIDERNL
jgi:hypothetical protein